MLDLAQLNILMDQAYNMAAAELSQNLANPENLLNSDSQFVAHKHSQIEASKIEVPVGALLLLNNGLILSSTNGCERSQLPFCHAEYNVLMAASVYFQMTESEALNFYNNDGQKQGKLSQQSPKSLTNKPLTKFYLEGATLIVTMEPCALCASLMANLRLSSLVFGAYSPKTGAIFHGPEIFKYSTFKPVVLGGLQEQRCSKLLNKFGEYLR